MILTALVAGAAAGATEAAGQAVKDGYAALKSLFVSKLGGKAEVEDALERVEKKPDSEARQAVLKEELETAEAQKDDELIKQAEAFLKLLEEKGVGPGATQVTVIGSGAAAVGKGAVAAGEGGVAIGGDVEGGIHIGGRREEDEQ